MRSRRLRERNFPQDNTTKLPLRPYTSLYDAAVARIESTRENVTGEKERVPLDTRVSMPMMWIVFLLFRDKRGRSEVRRNRFAFPGTNRPALFADRQQTQSDVIASRRVHVSLLSSTECLRVTELELGTLFRRRKGTRFSLSARKFIERGTGEERDYVLRPIRPIQCSRQSLPKLTETSADRESPLVLRRASVDGCSARRPITARPTDGAAEGWGESSTWQPGGARAPLASAFPRPRQLVLSLSARRLPSVATYEFYGLQW